MLDSAMVQEERTQENDAQRSPLRSIYTNNLPTILDHFGISLAVSTYQAGRVILVRKDADGINTHFRTFHKPMGIAASGQRLTIGGQNTVWYYRNMPAVAPKLAPAGKHDAAYLPRQIHVTGDIDIHEMAWAEDELWLVNTKFCCLCTLDPDHSFTPRWRPPFVSELAPEDRCHLNGLALQDGRPQYVTALGETDSAGAWRANKRDGGILMDVPSSKTLLRGLSMPHSPRLYNGHLWLLESGVGSLALVDPAARTWETVSLLPGFTRGIDFAGPLAFIGLSQVRESAVFARIPLVERLGVDERACGVWVVNIETGETVAFLQFEEGVQEIFAVQVLPNARFPEMLEWNNPTINSSYVIPDAALDDVPEQIRKPLKTAAPAAEGSVEFELQEGLRLLNANDFQGAEARFLRAQEMAPHRPEGYTQQGRALAARGRLAEAVDAYRQAIAVRTGDAQAHTYLGMAQLKQGNLAEGLANYEWRWRTDIYSRPPLSAPVWDGRALRGGTLLVRAEPDAAETVQFARFLPAAAARAGQLILEAPEPLRALLAEVEGVTRVNPPGKTAAAAYQAQASMTALAAALGVELGTLPAAEFPYLRPPADRSIDVTQIPGRPFKVGFAWQGSAARLDAAGSTIPLSALGPLFAAQGVAFYSLEYGADAGQAAQWLNKGVQQIFIRQIGDWADAAAAIQAMDLVIAADGPVAHLSGALGVPLWVLLPHAAGWTWLESGASTPWYPHVRLFRRQQPGAWAAVVSEVLGELQQFSGNSRHSSEYGEN